ncbi:MAG: transposase [Ghiorsea sp.]|nr:transposase [Ghiorsea sp.]
MPVHVVQRGNNRAPIFFDERDYRAYSKWLKAAAEKYGCEVHAYVLMTNHVHLLVTPKDETGLSRMMQYIGRYYVPYINHTYGRTGTLWEGRYKSSLVDTNGYFLTCCRYIELNPVRASMVSHPREYIWSSYATNAEGKIDTVVKPHPLYTSLGANEKARQQAYEALFEVHVDDVELSEIRASLQTGTPLGNDRFREEIEGILGKKIGQTRRGRPPRLLKGSDPF